MDDKLINEEEAEKEARHTKYYLIATCVFALIMYGSLAIVHHWM